MTPQNGSQADFDRLMRQWFEADGQGREPEHLLGSVLDRTSRTWHRPGWLLLERWLPMQLTMRAPAVPRLVPLTLLLIALLVAAALAIVYVGSHRVPPPFGPAANGLIAYDDNAAIYVANADGSNGRVVARASPYASAPTFSPDGKRIAFWGEDRPDSLFLVDADGSNLKRLAGDLWIETNHPPSWSPDGRSIAFSTESGPDRGDARAYVVDVAGGPPRLVGGGGPRNVNAYFPSWSPDGEWIAFVGVEGTAGARLWIVRPSGNDAHALASTPNLTVDQPQWDPSGTALRITYAASPSTSDPGLHDIYVFDVRSDRELALSHETADEYLPAWSPDGTRLAWLVGDHPSTVHVDTIDGAGDAKSLATGVFEGPVSWSPDGTLILGQSPNNAAVSVVSVDGSAPIVRIQHARGQGPPAQQRLAP
ncbi:MAG TPA: hypothetical protein VFV72_05680 [Candidatus Limnocylindrales bacterium]|nr:hypothetical protein [Candidatus Limnocylindrales bacterium]